MFDQIIESVLRIVIPICELMGITIVVISTVTAFVKYICSLITHKKTDVKFQLANGLATSLEFKMAAEILNTVLVRTFSELTVLAAVIVLRALLSFLINFEMKQREHKE